jgi:3',5'-cyclic AMP phosphodiesterase CpdA
MKHALNLTLALALLLPAASCRTTPKSAAAAPRYPVRIALLSDFHVTHRLKADQPWREKRLRQAADIVNREKVDLVLLGGDLTEDGATGELQDFRKLVREFDAPAWYIPGNHDIGNKVVPGKKESMTWERLKQYEMTLGDSWWVREHAGVRVVGVNAPLLGSGLGEERRMWADLEKALAKPAKIPTLMLLHFPPFQSSNSEPGGVYWNLEPYPRARLLGLAKQGGVKAILSGHLHQNLTNRFEGMTLLTTTTLGVGDPKKNPARGWMLLTVGAKGELTIDRRTVKDPEEKK